MGRDPHPLKNHKIIGFLSNTGPEPLKNHKATKLVFNIGPSLPRQRNAIAGEPIMAFCGRADDSLLILPPLIN